MKKYSILILVLVLTAVALTGCRSGGNVTEPTTMPATMPTILPTETTVPPTQQTETDSTEHSTPADESLPMAPDATGTTNGTDPSEEARARSMPRSR